MTRRELDRLMNDADQWTAAELRVSAVGGLLMMRKLQAAIRELLRQDGLLPYGQRERPGGAC